MDELRRSSGELVGMMGGSAGPSPFFWFLVFFGFFILRGESGSLQAGSAVPGWLADGLASGGHVVALGSTLRPSCGLGVGVLPPSCPCWA